MAGWHGGAAAGRLDELPLLLLLVSELKSSDPRRLRQAAGGEQLRTESLRGASASAGTHHSRRAPAEGNCSTA
jgi:hypothetical protein